MRGRWLERIRRGLCGCGSIPSLLPGLDAGAGCRSSTGAARQKRWVHGGRRSVLIFTHKNRIWSSPWRRTRRLPAVRVVSESVLSSLPGLDSPFRGRPSDKSLGYFRSSLRDGLWYRSDACWRGPWNRDRDSPRAGRRDPPAQRAIELSPAIHRWEKGPPMPSSPRGATERPYPWASPASRPASRAEPSCALRGAGWRRTCSDRILVGKDEAPSAPGNGCDPAPA